MNDRSPKPSPWFNLLVMTPAVILSVLMAGGGITLITGAILQHRPLPAKAEVATSPPSPSVAASPPATVTADAPSLGNLKEAGQKVYSTVCIACHQPTGQGLPGVFPPLAASDWVKAEDPSRIIAIVLCGLQGEVVVNGKPFTTMMAMPPQGPTLSDEQIAGALTFVRSSWGNQASPVSPDKVKELRARLKDRAASMWTAKDLQGALP